MERQEIDFAGKRAERELSQIGARVADANCYVEKIQDLSDKAEENLVSAQRKLSDLYESLEEGLAGPEEEAQGGGRPEN